MTILPPSREPPEFNSNYILSWNFTGLQLNRLTQSLAGPQPGPVLAARALGLLHLAIHDAYFTIRPDPAGRFSTYLRAGENLPPLNGASDPRDAVAGAASTVLRRLYVTPDPGIARDTIAQLSDVVQQQVDALGGINAISPSFRFGAAVGNALVDLLIAPNEPGADQGVYTPPEGPLRFDDDPTNPLRLLPLDPNDPDGPARPVRIYYAPFYGLTARRFAVQMSVNGQPNEHVVADPPVGFSRDDVMEYNGSIADVIRMGGQPASNTTRRRPDQMAGGFFWAYDGVNLIGTPPRLYNQILRKVAWNRRPGDGTSEEDNADFARLFALANAAMTDAGIFCWREKYTYEFWRPLSGIREDTGPLADPFFRTLSAPESNSNGIAFKPPFPAYPSGHAAFAAAAFQTARLYYKERDGLSFAADEPDNISFDFISDELDGVTRDLYQPYDPTRPITDQRGLVRTRVVRRFPSLWDAIFDNAISRIWLGVHWIFDAFAPQDVVPTPPETILYANGDVDSHKPVKESLTAPSEAVGPFTLEQDGTTAYADSATIRYDTTATRFDRSGTFPIGGVPLGIDIANDIFQSNLQPTPAEAQPL